MTIFVRDLIVASAMGQSTDPDGVLRIRRGVYLPTECIPEGSAPWQIRRIITEARALSGTLTLSADNPPILTLESALVMHGLNGWLNVCDISYRRLHESVKRQPMELPAVQHRNVSTCSALETQLTSQPATAEFERMHGALVLPLWAVAIDCARYLHPLAAFVALSQILGRYSCFNRFRMAQSREAESTIRNRLLEKLADFQGFRNVRRARALIESADAAIESPGEGCLLWFTFCVLQSAGIGKTEIRTQFPVQADGNLYYADIALPRYGIILEFDGATKVLAGGAAFLERQRNLHLAGWTVIRVDLRQLRNPPALVEYLVRELRKEGVPAGRPQGPLWESIPSSLVDPARRF